MRLAYAVFASVALAVPAAAASLPSFDSAAYCAKVGVIGLTQSTVMLDGCIREEVSARTEMDDTWNNLTPTEQGHCLTAATFAGDGSYAVMKSCLARLRADATLDGADRTP